jgi:hypothetical protein
MTGRTSVKLKDARSNKDLQIPTVSQGTSVRYIRSGALRKSSAPLRIADVVPDLALRESKIGTSMFDVCTE